jgi:hypothetical protein
LYRVGLTIHLQERLVQFVSLSYNELASAATDQERMMKVVAEVDEKKRKKIMHGSAGSGVYPTWVSAASITTTVELGNCPQFQPWQIQQQ